MAVNQEIYGNPNDWVRISGVDFTNHDMNYYYANFGDQSSYNVSSLKAGVDNSKISLNTPIDKSLSWCGLGNFSTFSNMECYNNKLWEVSEDPFKMINKDSRNVTNFALLGVTFPWSLANPTPSSWYYADTSNTTYASRARWSPEAGDGTSSTTGNFNMGLKPVTQIPMRNCICVPYIQCVENIDAILSSSHHVLMWDYLDPNSDYNYTNCPYILHVSMQMWGHINDNDTGNERTNRLVYTENQHIVILDATDACKGQPYNTLVPAFKQEETYQYYAMGYSLGINGLIIMGTVSSNNLYMLLPHSDGSNRQARGNLVLPHPNGQLKYLHNSSTSSSAVDRVLYYVEYYDGFQEWVRRQIACFGLFFTDDEQTAKYGDFDDENMFLGTLDSNLIGNGDYTHGSDNRSQPQWNWATTNQSPYIPQESGGGGEPYGDTTNFIKAGSGINPGGKWYADSNLGVWNGLLAWCNNLPVDGDDKLNLTQFYGQNPIDCIIEAKYIFVNDYTFGKTMGESGPITLGSYNNGGVNSYPFSTSHPVEFDCGYVDITRPWEDFRDYDPYTTISLILPFSDSIDLPTDIFMGHRCNLTEVIDPLTGDLIYYVFVDNVLYTSLTGNCAMDLSINGLETATYAQTRFSLQTQATVAKFNAIASLIGGASGASIAANLINPVGAAFQGLGGLVNMASGKYQSDRYETQMSRTAPPPAKIQKASSNVQWGSMPVPHIVVASPLMVDGYTDANYKEQTGFATYKVGKIGDEKGYVVCSSLNPSGLNCSKEETEMIVQALTQGIYIK